MPNLQLLVKPEGDMLYYSAGKMEAVYQLSTETFKQIHIFQ